MKREKIFTAIVMFLCFTTLPSAVFAQGGGQNVSSIDRIGTTAAPFLKIGAGARPIAMGGAYAALADDILSVYWNPAGLARIPGYGEAVFNHAEWLAETNYDFAAFSINMGSLGSFGFHVTSLSTPEQPVRTIANPDGTGQVWDANMIAVGVTFARNLTDDFAIGFTGKFIQEKIFNQSARGGAMDFGVLFRTPWRNLTLAASIANFGSKMQLDGRDLFFNEDPSSISGGVSEVPAEFRTEKFELPLNLKFGIAWQVHKSEDVTILAIADGVQPNDNSEFVNSGIEVGLKNVIFLRGGYRGLLLKEFEENNRGATFGVGLRHDMPGANLKFDFGWADYGRLSSVKFVSFAIRY